ncbi:MAG: prepilin-type N-terminal cleavage/methylation domain-containing protein [Phycisphaera sp.]|nr:MAG: prepilin-type N-terminal cleavage/methylation domain-containing protein [Phycisphaera sp.]
MKYHRSKHAFTLIELLVVISIIALLISILLPALGNARRSAQAMITNNNLRQHGVAAASYAAENDSRAYTFSWEPGKAPQTTNTALARACANLNPSNAAAFSEAAALQQLDIVTRLFKHESLDPDPGNASPMHTPYVLYNHLVINDHIGESLPAETVISPADRARTYWQKNIDEYLEDPAGNAFRPPSNQTGFNHLWRWAFSSSYQIVTAHYSPDYGNSQGSGWPATVSRVGSSHFQYQMPSQPNVLGRRRVDEVRFPGQKVMMYDEYQRHKGKEDQYYAFEDSSIPLLFYDGHAAVRETSEANFGVWPNNPAFGADDPDEPAAAYLYTPFDGWDPPSAPTGLRLPVIYEHTRMGLQGVDFDGKPFVNRGFAERVSSGG